MVRSNDGVVAPTPSACKIQPLPFQDYMMPCPDPFVSIRRVGIMLALSALICPPALAESRAAGPSKPSTYPEGPNPRNARPVLKGQSCLPPVWRSSTLRNGEHAEVSLALLIGPDGRVDQARIDGSSGFAALDMAAKQSFTRCSFLPAIVDGKAMPAWLPVRYVWTQEGEHPAPDRRHGKSRS